MAGIIYDRKLTTFVPEGFECLSACAFMFFAGDAKVSAGELGVHQFSKDEEVQKKKDEKLKRTLAAEHDCELFSNTFPGLLDGCCISYKRSRLFREAR